MILTLFIVFNYACKGTKKEGIIATFVPNYYDTLIRNDRNQMFSNIIVKKETARDAEMLNRGQNDIGFQI